MTKGYHAEQQTVNVKVTGESSIGPHRPRPYSLVGEGKHMGPARRGRGLWGGKTEAGGDTKSDSGKSPKSLAGKWV